MGHGGLGSTADHTMSTSAASRRQQGVAQTSHEDTRAPFPNSQMDSSGYGAHIEKISTRYVGHPFCMCAHVCAWVYAPRWQTVRRAETALQPQVRTCSWTGTHKPPPAPLHPRCARPAHGTHAPGQQSPRWFPATHTRTRTCDQRSGFLQHPAQISLQVTLFTFASFMA